VFAPRGVEFAEQILHAPLDGFVADAERARNLLVRKIAGDEPEHLAFLGREQACHRAPRRWRLR
jgi:hypothetical protein